MTESSWHTHQTILCIHLFLTICLCVCVAVWVFAYSSIPGNVLTQPFIYITVTDFVWHIHTHTHAPTIQMLLRPCQKLFSWRMSHYYFWCNGLVVFWSHLWRMPGFRKETTATTTTFFIHQVNIITHFISKCEKSKLIVIEKGKTNWKQNRTKQKQVAHRVVCIRFHDVSFGVWQQRHIVRCVCMCVCCCCSKQFVRWTSVYILHEPQG